MTIYFYNNRGIKWDSSWFIVLKRNLTDILNAGHALMGEFSAKVGKKQDRDQAVGEYGISTRNTKVKLLVELAERNNLRIMNTLSRKRENCKWTWRSPNGETKNEIGFILRSNPGIVQDVEMLSKVRYCDHGMVRSRINLDLRSERKEPVRKKPINEFAVR